MFQRGTSQFYKQICAALTNKQTNQVKTSSPGWGQALGAGTVGLCPSPAGMEPEQPGTSPGEANGDWKPLLVPAESFGDAPRHRRLQQKQRQTRLGSSSRQSRVLIYFLILFIFYYFQEVRTVQEAERGGLGLCSAGRGGMRTGHAERSPAAEAHARSAPWHAGDPRPAQAGMRCRARPQHGPSLGNKRPELSRAGGNPLRTTAGATPARALHPQHLLSLCHLLGLERNLNLAFDTFLKP